MAITWLNKEELLPAVQKKLESADKVLDIGCGIRPQSLIESKIHICAEPFSEYVEILQNRYAGNPRYVILNGTADHILSLLPDNSVDTVFLIDVIEHLEKDLGHTIIKECDRVARKQIVLFTPIGFMHQESSPDGTDAWGLHGEEWQDHKSGWMPEEFDDTWAVAACELYHEYNGVGERFDPPVGAFWAIKSKGSPETGKKFDRKVLFVSNILPPSLSDQAAALYRLLSGIDPNSYGLVSAIDYDDPSFLQTTTQRLPARYHWLGKALEIRRFNHPIANRLSLILITLSKIINGTRRLQKIIKDEQYRSIIVCMGNPTDLPVAYLSSLRYGVPLYLYYFNNFSERWAGTPIHMLVKVVESLALRRSKGVIVPNEKLANELGREKGVKPTLIRNPAFDDQSVRDAPYEWPKRSDEIRIVHTGPISCAQDDTFKVLLQALKELTHINLTLHLYTVQTRGELEKRAICGPFVLHQRASYSVIREAQREADILYLPLSFEPEISKYINTLSPGMMGEYLASGRPILVHAPPTSYVYSYFKENECGFIVDQNECEAIKNGINRVISDEKLRHRMSINASDKAEVDFGAEKSQMALIDLVKQSI